IFDKLIESPLQTRKEISLPGSESRLVGNTARLSDLVDGNVNPVIDLHRSRTDFLVELPNHPGVPKTYDKLRNSRDSRCIRSKHVGAVRKLFVQCPAEYRSDRVSLFISKFEAGFLGENKGLPVHRELR